MITRFINLFWALSLPFFSEMPVRSQSTIYFDRLSFQLAAQNVPGNYQTISTFPWANGPELTISDITFRGRELILGPNGSLYNFDGSMPGLSIHFANGARALGADFSSALSIHGYSSFTATISLDSGEIFQFTAPTDPNFRFFGFISPTPISDMTFSDGGILGLPALSLHEELLGNVTVVTVPEPSSLALQSCGAVLLAGHFLRRFRKRK